MWGDFVRICQIFGDGRKIFYPPYQLFKQCLWTIFTCNNLVLIDFSKRIILCHSLISNFLLKSILSSLDWHIQGLTHTYVVGFPSAESLMFEQIVLVCSTENSLSMGAAVCGLHRFFQEPEPGRGEPGQSRKSNALKSHTMSTGHNLASMVIPVGNSTEND